MSEEAGDGPAVVKATRTRRTVIESRVAMMAGPFSDWGIEDKVGETLYHECFGGLNNKCDEHIVNVLHESNGNVAQSDCSISGYRRHTTRVG